jgi:hypothetical protein
MNTIIELNQNEIAAISGAGLGTWLLGNNSTAGNWIDNHPYTTTALALGTVAVIGFGAAAFCGYFAHTAATVTAEPIIGNPVGFHQATLGEIAQQTSKEL